MASPADGIAVRSRLWALTAAIVVLAVAAAGAAVATGDDGFGPLGLVAVFTALLALTRVLPFVVVRRGEGEEVSADEAVLVAMLVLLPAGGVLAAAVVGTVLAHVIRRRDVLKSVYNHGVQALGVSAALLVEHVLADPEQGATSGAALAAACAGVLLYSAITSSAIRVAVATATRVPIGRLVVEGAVVDLVAALAATGWGAVAVAATTSAAASVAVLAVPIVGSSLIRHNEQQHRSMHALLRAAVATGQAVRSGGAADELIDAADELLRTQGSRLSRTPPLAGELGVPLASRGGQLWLVAGKRHPRDTRGRADRTLLDALAAIGDIALENEALLDAAGRDPDTELITGALLHERIDVLIEEVGADGLAVIVVRVPRLDTVKETLGPVAARRERAEVAQRLLQVVEPRTAEPGPPALVGFLGDGDFTVVLPRVTGAANALEAARQVERALRDPVTVDGVALTVEAAIGVRVCSPRAEEVASASLLQEAVATAARIARVGGERIQLSQPDDGDAGAPTFALEAQLRHALRCRELLVAYQPILTVAGERVIGAEALVRWKHPTRDWLQPGQFIPVAEQSSLIVAVDRYVLRDVAEQLRTWHDQGLPSSFAVSVNMSARHLVEPDTVDFVRRLLGETGVEPHRIKLEVTESSVTLDAVAAAHTLDALHQLGLGIAIDDFGTGYSSMLYLRDFPTDAMKIDRSFIDRMGASPGDAAIVAAIIRLGHTLGLSIVAEGVERPEQRDALRSLGCDAAQGFLWSEAVRPERFRAEWWPSASDPGPIAEVPDGSSATGDAIRDDVLPYVIHELRSPLFAIGAYTGLVADELAGDDQAGSAPLYVERIRHATESMRAVLDDLGDVSTLDLAGMDLDIETVELNELVRAALGTIGPAVGHEQLELRAGPPMDVDVDKHRIGQVLRNLISNAAKFSAATEPIIIQVTQDPAGCHVRVRDHGRGVPTDQVGQLFRRFSRLGSSTKGMGIGLHLARKIARAHGGDVTYEAPADGPGSTFTIHLPPSTRAPAGSRPSESPVPPA